ncbi:PaaI family thioesterase [Phenylobacterium sp.]|uniref:PaaI family thioesterase n=1 Tax=Phenylobacterium sp. TaxID=1871053 RepID=UPI00272F2450|nr:hotdog domain-containing protein [Phenylobacterium sp.]MDP1873502.1 hotdog domain-containing protein [Phenylobacterium sp.]MDP3299162.1 hotdog domain-containing protein [Phenylobacterium sp.]
MIPSFPASSSAPVRTAGLVPAGAGAGAALIEVALAAASGEDLAPVSLTLDYAAPLAAGEAVTLEAAIERTTRTLVFAHGRVLRADGALAVTGSAVFRRLADSGKA